MFIYSDYTALSDCILYKAYSNVQIYPLISFWVVNIHQVEVPQYMVCLPCGPIHMGMFLNILSSLKMGVAESLTHTSGHRLVKSTPPGVGGSCLSRRVCVGMCHILLSFQTLYDPWFISCYNLFFTSGPILALGIFDQVCLRVKRSEWDLVVSD